MTKWLTLGMLQYLPTVSMNFEGLEIWMLQSSLRLSFEEKSRSIVICSLRNRIVVYYLPCHKSASLLVACSQRTEL